MAVSLAETGLDRSENLVVFMLPVEIERSGLAVPHRQLRDPDYVRYEFPLMAPLDARGLRVWENDVAMTREQAMAAIQAEGLLPAGPLHGILYGADRVDGPIWLSQTSRTRDSSGYHRVGVLQNWRELPLLGLVPTHMQARMGQRKTPEKVTIADKFLVYDPRLAASRI